MTHRTTTKSSSTIPGLLLAILVSIHAPAQSRLTVIHGFGGSDGANPQATLVIDEFGLLYGTTVSGGTHNRGTVFRLTPPQNGGAWTETILHSFTGGSDGVSPATSLLLDGTTKLYGTTEGGGASGRGVAFRLTRGLTDQWSEAVLHSFANTGGDAVNPDEPLVMDNAGNLYGSGPGGQFGFGAVFKLVRAGGLWTETTLHSFDESDGYKPNGLAIDKTGLLYGTMQIGGPPGARGLVFTVTPTSGSGTERAIHTFTGSPDGDHPQNGLLLAQDGALYGTTSGGGGQFDAGMVFKLTPTGNGNWTETVLYSFKGGSDGIFPSGLVADRNGAFYGTMFLGGASNQGVVFKLIPQADGVYTESVLHSFSGSNDGGQPLGGVVLDSSGALYGTTSVGGPSNMGVVFRIK